MPEHQFTDARLAALYDRFYPPGRRDDFAFYLPLILASRSALDVGCGTGALLHLAREAGHTGRLCGLDPAAGMLAQARQRDDIDWVHCDPSSMRWQGEFDLITMTGHAFQEWTEDEQIRAALAAIRAALAPDGRFAFETRNPLDRAWERWAAQYSNETTDADGNLVTCTYRVIPPDADGVVRSINLFTSPAWSHTETSYGTLRFIDPAALATFLADAGLVIEHQYGDWDRSPLTPASPEVITIACRSYPRTLNAER